MPPDLRREIEKRADAKGRTLTAEINTRLRESLKAEASFSFSRQIEELPYTANTLQEPPTRPWTTMIKADPAEASLINVFRQLPAEKQLALLALLK